MTWTIVTDETAFDAAYALARGSYQRDLLCGGENLSGSSLRGAAARLSGHNYARSRGNLLTRIRRAGIPASEIQGSHGKRILVIGPDTIDPALVSEVVADVLTVEA